jgi:hypothetical protein
MLLPQFVFWTFMLHVAILLVMVVAGILLMVLSQSG